MKKKENIIKQIEMLLSTEENIIISDEQKLKFERIVIQSKNPGLCYRFAKYVSNADIRMLGEVVLASKDPFFNRLFSKIEGADKVKHTLVAIEAGSYYFQENGEDLADKDILNRLDSYEFRK